jgi:HEPN domain-containing protein
MCHQSIEKMLKALFTDRFNGLPPKTHNLPKLAELTGIKDELSEEQDDFLYDMDPMNIEARYPDYKNDLKKLLTESKTHEMLLETDRLLKWLKARLN